MDFSVTLNQTIIMAIKLGAIIEAASARGLFLALNKNHL
jgi:hypothetical protein